MRKIHKLAAVGISSLIVSVALAPAALAAGAVSGAAAGRAYSAPNTKIKGRPAHFSPKSLSVKARWAGSPAPCTTSSDSFKMTNKKNVAETVRFYSGSTLVFTTTVQPHSGEIICIKKGATGTVVGKLNDGRKLTVHVS